MPWHYCFSDAVSPGKKKREETPGVFMAHPKMLSPEHPKGATSAREVEYRSPIPLFQAKEEWLWVPALPPWPVTGAVGW